MEGELQLTLEGLRAISHLQRAISLTDGFALYVLVLESPAATHVAVRALKRRGAGDMVVLEAPDTSTPDWMERYLEDVQREAKEGRRPLVLDMTAIDTRDVEGWTLVLHRLNFGRNALVRALNRPLILVVSPRFEPLLAGEAPDLWSVRTLTLVVDVARPDRYERAPWYGRFPELPPSHYRLDQIQTQLDTEVARGASPLSLAVRHTQLAEALLAHSRPEEALQHGLKALDLRAREDLEQVEIASGLYFAAALVVEAANQTLRPLVGVEAVDRALARLEGHDASDPRVLEALALLHMERVRPLVYLNRAREGLESARQAVEPLRRLCSRSRSQFEVPLVEALLREGEARGALGDLEGTRIALHEARTLVLQVAEPRSSQIDCLAQEVLIEEASNLIYLKRHPEAQDCIAHAEQIGRQHRGDSPHLRATVATSIDAWAMVLLDRQLMGPAVAKLTETVAMWRTLADECPLLGRQRLAGGLLFLATGLSAAGHVDLARDRLEDLNRTLLLIGAAGPSSLAPALAHRTRMGSRLLLNGATRAAMMQVLRTLCDVLALMSERSPLTHLAPYVDTALALLTANDPDLTSPASADDLAQLSRHMRSAPSDALALVLDRLLKVERLRAQIAADRSETAAALQLCRSALALVANAPDLHADTRGWVGGLHELAATVLQSQRRFPEARSDLSEALKHLRLAHAENPARHARALTFTLQHAARLERDLGHKRLARDLAAEALDVLWPVFENTAEDLQDEIGELLRLNLRLARGGPSRSLAERVQVYEKIIGAPAGAPPDKSTHE